jgi:Peptide methionine sulfoxide reductase
MLGFRNKREMVDSADALPGRDRQMPVPARHEVLGAHLAPPFAYAQRLREAGYPEITTEITEAGPLYCAEDYHQQYLAKNPWGYCGLGGTGVSCPVGVGVAGKAS